MDRVTRQNIDRVLAFLPLFERREARLYGIQVEPPTMDPYRYSAEVQQFVHTLYDEGFVVTFDWPAWQEEAQRFVHDPDLLRAADLPTLQKLLTTHVRKDRFCGGHLAQMIDDGHVLAILKRLEAIRVAGNSNF